MRELLQNSHLRLVTVGDIEIHLQGLSFNAICDEIGSAHVSLVQLNLVYINFMLEMFLVQLEPIGSQAYKKQGNMFLENL